ncbi:hypothetical protein E4U54_000927 [Claviceps lovelessii]|nr:hypothetical protein E4U54_000927 [Claviceps lovelessii]
MDGWMEHFLLAADCAAAFWGAGDTGVPAVNGGGGWCLGTAQGTAQGTALHEGTTQPPGTAPAPAGIALAQHWHRAGTAPAQHRHSTGTAPPTGHWAQHLQPSGRNWQPCRFLNMGA